MRVVEMAMRKRSTPTFGRPLVTTGQAESIRRRLMMQPEVQMTGNEGEAVVDVGEAGRGADG